MAVRNDPRIQNVYPAARRWVEECLLADGSLFTPGRPIWTAANAAELRRHFVEEEDTSEGRFLEKLRSQLRGADDAVIQLMAELMFVHMLVIAPRSMKGRTKRGRIEDILAWMRAPAGLPSDLSGALEIGPASIGSAQSHRFHHLRYLVDFVLAWKSLGEDRREELLRDPWAFKAWLDEEVDRKLAQTQRHALLHLVHPETFEDILSEEHKRRISETFSDLVETHSEDLDRRLFEIRRALDRERGQGWSFYDLDLRSRWNRDDDKWEAFLGRAERILAEDREAYEQDEIHYKLAVGERMARAKQALAAGEDWFPSLREAFTRDTNLTNWRAHDRFLQWVSEHREEAANGLAELWDEQAPLRDRIRRFTARIAGVVDGLGDRTSIVSVLLSAHGMTRYPPYRARFLDQAVELLGFPKPGRRADEADRYLHALELYDRIVEEASGHGLELERGRLDAQSLLWRIVNDQDRRAADVREAPPPSAGASGDLGALARRLLLDESSLAKIVRLLEDNRQVVFYGPPGTGKTFVAQELAGVLAPGRVELVQFHPSYSYEDFVEGFRPRLDEGTGQAGFELRQGPLKRIARRAAADPGNLYVLIVDEMNRGNLAKVFGELYFLLEYRDRKVNLLYSDEPFALPKNLWIVGTMNTADRSIALLDAALRRRFRFVPFFPTEPPIQGLLRRWLRRNRPELVWLADVVDAANARLEDRHAAIGPSYFLREELDEDWVELIWEHSVLPYVAERLFGQEDRIADFELEGLRDAVRGEPPSEDDAQVVSDGG